MQTLSSSERRSDKYPSLSSRGAISYHSLGWGMIVFIFGGLAIWTILAPIHGAVVSEGVIQVESNRKSIQHLENGIVKHILVKEGDYVKKGEILIQLDTTLAKASKMRLETQLLLYTAKLSRLLAERSDSTEIDFGEFEALPFGGSKKQEIIRTETALFRSRRARQEGDKAALRAEIAQSEAKILGLKAQSSSLDRQLELVTKETENYRKLYERGYATLPRLLAMERAIENLRGQNALNDANIAEAHKLIQETQIRLKQTNNVLDEQIAGELETTKVRLSELSEQYKRTLDELRRADITAPHAGNVLALSVFSEGAVVTAGTPLMQIVPAGDPLVIIAFVRPQDIDQVHLGADCRIRFTAFSQRTTPEFMGKVEEISDDRVVDERSGQAAYRLQISIPASPALENFLLKPGMPAEVFVQTETRTVMSYLLKPLSDAVSRSFR